MEEFFIPTVTFAMNLRCYWRVTKIKSLMSSVKTTMNLHCTPTFLTMNGNNITDITKFCSNEFDAISNRCYLYLLKLMF